MAYRLLMLLALVVNACAAAYERHDNAAHRLLDEAIVAAGGLHALSAHSVVAWTGSAHVYTKGKTITISVDTIVDPPKRAKSRTWLADVGPSSERTMEIRPSGGTLTRGGVTTPLPIPMFRHERIQYAIYELLRLAPLLRNEVRLTSLPKNRTGLRGLRVQRPGLPSADMWFDGRASPVMVETVLADPDSGAMIDEKLTFTGQMQDKGVRWPKIVQITWNGAPYFDLALSTFSVTKRLD